nr:MAG TPA: hypothetical protein [Caudoviricetes sp.]
MYIVYKFVILENNKIKTLCGSKYYCSLCSLCSIENKRYLEQERFLENILNIAYIRMHLIEK